MNFRIRIAYFIQPLEFYSFSIRNLIRLTLGPSIKPVRSSKGHRFYTSMPEVPVIVKREPGASIKTVPFTGQLASGSQIQAPGAVNFRSPSPQRQTGGVKFSAVVSSVQSDLSSSAAQVGLNRRYNS